jgi:membrane associated rhomboid family serine protease
MFGLFIFGIVVEKELGWKKYLFIYIVSGLGSAFLYIIFEGLKSTVLMLGASGAVFGVLTAYAFKFPKNWVIVFPGIPMPAALLVVFYIILEFVLGIFNLEPGIANFSHLGGIITSLIIMFYFRHKEERDIMLSDW